MRRWCARARDPSGMALLVTLMVMVILAVLIHRFTFATRVHLAAAANARDELKAQCLASSGVEVALAVMENDQQEEEEAQTPQGAVEQGAVEQENKEAPSEKTPAGGTNALEILSQRIQEFAAAALDKDEGSFKVTLRDESARIDINRLIREDSTVDGFIEGQLRKLLRIFGHTDDELDTLMDPLLDWLDKDDDRRPEGAEGLDYQSLDDPYTCRNGPLRTLGELTLVKGWRGFWEMRLEDGTTLADCLTVGPTGGRININTASSLVLQSLNEKIDEAIAAQIIARRDELSFDNIADLFVLLDFLTNPEKEALSAYLQIKPSLLTISSEGSYRRAVVRVEARLKNQQEGLRIASWRVE